MEKVRVLHFEIDEHIGGIERFIYNVYRTIDRDKIQFDLVTEVEHPALELAFKELGANIYHVQPVSNVSGYIKDIKKLLCKDYDIVHIHKNSASNIIPILLASQYPNTKIFLHSHNTKPSMGKITSLLHFMNRKKAWKMADYRFACSQVAGKWMYGDRPFTVINNGIQCKDFEYKDQIRKEIREELNISQNALLVIHVGRFTDQKNHIKLIGIFKKIYEKHRNAVLCLVGEGQLMENIRERCKGSNLNNCVKFLGACENVPPYLIASDICIMPSKYEGLCISAVEAQAAGVFTCLSWAFPPETFLCSEDTMKFSIDDSDEKIAEEIIDKYNERCTGIGDRKSNRVAMNIQVKKTYDISSTAAILSEYYISNQRK